MPPVAKWTSVYFLYLRFCVLVYFTQPRSLGWLQLWVTLRQMWSLSTQELQLRLEPRSPLLRGWQRECPGIPLQTPRWRPRSPCLSLHQCSPRLQLQPPSRPQLRLYRVTTSQHSSPEPRVVFFLSLHNGSLAFRQNPNNFYL